MEFEHAVRARKMVRRYTSEPVSPAQLERIMDLARRGPSAGFSQGTSFVVVTDNSLRRQIAEIAAEPRYVARGFAPWLSEAPVHVVCCVCEQAYRSRYDEPDKRRPGKPPRAWPVPYWYVDGGSAVMLLLLAATDEGLGAGFLDLGAEGYRQLKQLLGVPGDVEPIGLVTLGHPAAEQPSGSATRPRRSRDDVVHHERWGD